MSAVNVQLCTPCSNAMDADPEVRLLTFERYRLTCHIRAAIAVGNHTDVDHYTAAYFEQHDACVAAVASWASRALHDPDVMRARAEVNASNERMRQQIERMQAMVKKWKGEDPA